MSENVLLARFRAQNDDRLLHRYSPLIQVLVMRDAAVEPLYALVSDGVHLVAPHRLLPFPRSDDFDPALALKLKDKGGNSKELRDNDAQTLHTVMSPQGEIHSSFNPQASFYALHHHY